MTRRLLTSIALLLLISMTVGYAVFQVSYRVNLDNLAETGRIRVEQATDRLSGQLAAFRVLVNLLAQHPVVVDTVRSGQGRVAALDLLEQALLTYGAAGIVILARDGTPLLSAGEPPLRSRPLLTAALNARLGREHGLVGDRRVLRFSRGVITDNPPPVGAVIVSADLAALEFEWGVDPEAIAFFDNQNVVFAANRTSLLLKQDRPDGPTSDAYQPFPGHEDAVIAGHAIWRFQPSEELPTTALIAERAAPQFQMLARGFIDIGPARDTALLRGLLAAALVGVLGLITMIVLLWRRRMADRLAFEADANAQLEARVDARTSELRATQDQLVQASKLTALGQMSAGISHELNQPLAAIMNFAENGGKLLQLGRTNDVRGNLDQIAGQVTRADRIIRNLRSFARSEDEVIEAVDLNKVVSEALALVQTALEKSAATIHRDGPEAPMMVMGGQVRLQQVLVNLISNALDAMADQDNKVIHLTTSATPRNAVLTIRDTGPGIADPERVFEPFYTTKDLGASKGLGLGLSISYGIVGSFGGQLSCANAPGGGAVFTIELPLAEVP